MNKFYMMLVAALVLGFTSVRAEEATPPTGPEVAAAAGKAAEGAELLRQFDSAARTAEGGRFQSLGHGAAWKERCGRATAAAAGFDGGLFEAAAAPFQAGADASAWVASQAEPAAVAAARERRLEAIKGIELEVGLEAGSLE